MRDTRSRFGGVDLANGLRVTSAAKTTAHRAVAHIAQIFARRVRRFANTRAWING